MSTTRRAQLILASVVVTFGLGMNAPAFAQTSPSNNVSSASSDTVVPPEVEDTVVTPPVTVTTVPAEVAGEVIPEAIPEVLAEEVSNGNLAFTGTDAAGLSLLGLGAIGLGASLIAIKRRRANV